jgi:hypothetical protein
MLGLTAAVAVHLLAGLALLPVARLSVQGRSHPADDTAPVTVVQLIRLRPQTARSQPQPQPPREPRPKTLSLPEEAAPFETALADPEAPGPSAPSRPENDDPIYRVPFRDAVAQADARLRAGLGCAHVDLEQLPKTVFDLCAAAARLRNDGRPRGPLG